MNKYVGVKLIEAESMTRGKYNEFRGWTIPENEDPSDEGYLVKYSDGYISWSPSKVFEDTHIGLENCKITQEQFLDVISNDLMNENKTEFSFGTAIEMLKKGYKMARKGWNGKNMFIVYQKGYPQGIACNKQTAEAFGINEGDLFVCNPYLQIKNVDGSASMWVPSINDVLSEDWQVVEMI